MASVISREEVAPAGNATEMSLPLTLFDMTSVFYYRIVRFLVFYRLPAVSRESFVETTIPSLMTSLSLALKHFLPMAGNLVSPSDCSTKLELRYMAGDSVSITFTESGGDFNSLVANHPRDVKEFYPLVPRLPEAKKHIYRANNAEIVVPLLGVQVTVFPGFGICIGTTHHHAAGDGNTLISFLKEWAMMCKVGGDAEKRSFPFYDRTVVKDPYGAGDKMLQDMKKKFKIEPSEAQISTPARINKVRATYIMRRTDIEKLKNVVAQGTHNNKNVVSGFTITCAYLWTSILKARRAAAIGEEQAEEQKIEYFAFSADCRSRLNPPLPKNYFGNCIVKIVVKSKRGMLVGKEGFVTAAELIGEAIHKTVTNQERILNSDFWYPEFEEAVKHNEFGVTGHPRLDIYSADFGWGKPEKVEFVANDASNVLSICMVRDSEGDYEVGLVLPRNVMDAFAVIFAHGLTNL